MVTYLPRVVDGILNNKLSKSGAVLIEGPKWVGKTRSAENVCRSAFYIEGYEQAERIRGALSGDSYVLKGDIPRLIDEWQVVPAIWDKVRFAVDHRDGPGQFVLTGSSVPLEEATLHSGAGRFAIVKMRTMSLFESKESNGTISLRDLFDGTAQDSMTDLTLDGIAHAMVRGGWPKAVTEDNGSDPGYYVKEYLNIVMGSDMNRMLYNSLSEGEETGRKREGKVRLVTDRIIRSISRNISTSVNYRTILRDVNAQDSLISEPTLRKYILVLERMFILENLEAWNNHIRSRTTLVKSAKWNFTDPSIAAAALSIGEEKLLRDFESMGLLFESMCLRDVRIYSEPLGAEVFYLRNDNGYEVDFIVQSSDGRWGAFEVKLGDSQYDDAARNLLKLREFVDTSKCGEPSFLAILTGMPYGYTRDDGIKVVPIGCLRD